MNISNAVKTSFGLNLTTLIALVIALIAGSAIAADMYGIVKRIDMQNKANGDAVNQTISQILETQEKANTRGNLTILYFEKIFKQQLYNEDVLIGNLTDHRLISNQTRDNQTAQHQQLIDLLKQILNQTR
jgi:hypothetical protein